MIEVTKFNGEKIVLNADWIESVEKTPDTVIKLITGKKILVKNPVEEITGLVIKYKQLCHQTVRVIDRRISREEEETGGEPVVVIR